MIAGIVLAAGEGRRFGANKLLHPVEGRPLIYHSLAAATASRLDGVYAVVGHEAERLQPAIDRVPSSDPITIIVNERYGCGLMSSVKCGLQALDPDCRAAMVLLADMPYVSSETIDRLIAAFEEKETFVVASAGGTPTHPRIIPRAYFHHFMTLGDDEKGQGVIEEAGYVEVAVPPGSARDVDRPQDLL